MDVEETYRFRRQLDELKKARGRATELISLYIPPEKRLSDVAAYLKNEYSQSSNIKSKGTRKNVMAAIESIQVRLKAYRTTPPRGIAFFVGHLPKPGGQSEMVSYAIEPPEPTGTYQYRCDSTFHLEPLEGMLAEKENYGLLVIDRKEATIGILRGKRIETTQSMSSRVPGKHGRGGQSQHRFERLIEQAVHEFFKEVGEKATNALGEGLEGILVGGPGGTKQSFLSGDYLGPDVRRAVIDTFDTSYTNEAGLRELVDASTEALREIGLMREKRIVQQFLTAIAKGGLVAYGENDVRGQLNRGAVQTLLLSYGLKGKRVRYRCTCGYKEEETVIGEGQEEPKTCPLCNAPLTAESKDLIEDLLAIAKEAGTHVEMISVDTEEGETLLALGGIGATLRFR